MKMFLAAIALLLCGCTSVIPVPDTLGDPKNAKSYGYHPLDPLPINLSSGIANPLDVLPDETMRLAIGSISAEGGLSFGPAKIGTAGNHYVVILDYIKFGTDSLPVSVSQRRDVRGNRIATLAKSAEEANAIVPVYIGVGLRLTANIVVRKGSVDLGNLFALGAAAKAQQISGTLVIQTLGVSGPQISGLVPMPGEISEATIQNAILALASIKAKMYDPSTRISPRVVGVYNTLGGGEATINGFISSILERPIKFPK